MLAVGEITIILKVYLLEFNNGVIITWQLANVPAGSQSQTNITTVNLPITFNNNYRAAWSLRSGGANWANTGYLLSNIDASKFGIRIHNHFANYNALSFSIVCVGF